MSSGNKPDEKDFYLSLSKVSDLMEKKSVRATFRLSEEFIEALSIISAQLGIKQKSLFDHLMEDMEMLNALAGSVDPGRLDRKGRVQKTFVISKRSLSSLTTISKKFEISRDDLVEYSIRRLLPILIEERSKQHHREKAFSMIADHFRRTETLMDDLTTLLGKDDPIYQTMETIYSLYKNACADIESFVEKGKRIDDLPMKKFE